MCKMTEIAKKILVAILTHIIGTTLLVFAAVGMMNAGCPDYALYVWVVITGFFLACGMAEVGLRVIPTKKVEGVNSLN